MLDINIASFTYPSSNKEVLSHLSFEVQIGQHWAILGESGCGKSTLLHLIYGLLNLEKGSIVYKGKQIFGPSHNLIPGHTFMKLVSQELNLMPYTTVSENISENLQRIDKEADSERVLELLEVVGLERFAGSKVSTLSGGQKQRVALAKALATPPEILLLDEPFSSIDTFKKNTLRRKLFSYLKYHQISCITATHDSEEALAFADRLLILKDGQEIASGAPEKVFSSLNSTYEAGFFGEVTELPANLFQDSLNKSKTVFLPHQLAYSETATPLATVVQNSYFKGHNYLIESVWNNNTVFFEHPSKIEKDSTIYIQPV